MKPHNVKVVHLPTRAPSGFADLTAEHRYFALAVIPQRLDAAKRSAFFGGFAAGALCGGLWGALVALYFARWAAGQP